VLEKITPSFWSALLALNLAFANVGVAPAEETFTADEISDTLYSSSAETQTLVVPADVVATPVVRDSFTVTAAPPPPPPKPVAAQSASAPNVTPDPGSAQAEAWNQVQARGWGQDQFNCLVSLWQKESNWRVNANNPSSGAYGIPQSLPGSKMASAGADWQTNPATQITWGLNYISDRYSTPCGAWGKSENSGWY
jgi:hypothetical protein